MRLKRWGVVLAMLLALGCGEEKGSVGGNDARGVESGDPLNATSADSKAGGRDVESTAHERECKEAAEKLCKWRSGQSASPYTQQELDECVARRIAKCAEGEQ